MSNQLFDIGKPCLVGALPFVRSIHFALPDPSGRLPIQGVDPIVDSADITGPYDPEQNPPSQPLPQTYIEKELSTAKFSERQIANSDAGDYIQQSLEIVIKKDRLDVKRNIIRLMNNRVHVFLGFFDGSYKFVTSMRHVFAHSNLQDGKDQYTITLTAKKLLPAPWLSGFIPNASSNGTAIPPSTGGGTGGSPTYLDVAISRWTYPNRTGSTLAIEPNLPGNAEKLHIYRNGVLLVWGTGVQKVGDNLLFPSDDLDDDLIEVIYFNY